MSEEQELKLIRDEIDKLDYQIHDLINERAKLALKVLAVKVKYGEANIQFERPERERLILERIREYNQGPLDENTIERIFQTIIRECRDLQKATHMRNCHE